MKVLMGMKWTMTHCSQVRYIIRANGDVFIDMIHLVKVLVTRFSQVTRTMLGSVMTTPVLRDTQYCTKWCVSLHDHPHMNVYPFFFQGSIYIMTSDLLPEFYTKSLTINFL